MKSKAYKTSDRRFGEEFSEEDFLIAGEMCCLALLPHFPLWGSTWGIRRQKATSLEICKVVVLRVDGVISKVFTQKALKFCSLTSRLVLDVLLRK